MIVCRDLTREYRKGETVIRPLDGLDLEVADGEFLAMMGPSGSGKTTLLNIIAGIDSPSSGSIAVGDVDLTSLSKRALASWRSSSVGYIFQLYNLVPVLTAWENVELPLLLKDLSKSERRARVDSALDRVGILDRSKHFPRQLSGGQEQRVAIARAIVTEPRLIVADEPTGDLDKPTARAVMELLQELNEDRTVIMVTHDPETTRYARRTLHLEGGRVAEDVS